MKKAEYINGLRVSEYFFLRLSHGSDVVQLFWLGMEKDPSLEPVYTSTYSRIMVHIGHLVWMGLLLLHRLALGCEGKNGIA